MVGAIHVGRVRGGIVGPEISGGNAVAGYGDYFGLIPQAIQWSDMHLPIVIAPQANE